MEPQRTCVGCRTVTDQSDLVRLVWDRSTATVLVDPLRRAPGRGCYVHPDCVDTAVQRRAVGRALRVSVDPAQVAAVLSRLRAD